MVSAFAVNPSGTLPVLYITTENNTPVTSKDTYLNATYYLDAKGIVGYEKSLVVQRYGELGKQALALVKVNEE